MPATSNDPRLTVGCRSGDGFRAGCLPRTAVRLGARRLVSSRQAARKACPSTNFPPEAMDQLLAGWEGTECQPSIARGRHLSHRQETWPGATRTHFAGHAAFKNPDLAYVDYRKVKMQVQPDPKVKGKRIFTPIIKKDQFDSTPFQTILCTGKEVWDYRWDVKQIIVWTLDKDARKAGAR